MIHVIAAAMLASAAVDGGTAGTPIEHSVRVDHASGAVEATYSSRVKIAYRQIGSVAPPGRPSSLRCAWRAELVAERKAQHVSGSVLQRSLPSVPVAEGSRAGWCSPQHKSIAREVARSEAQAHAQLVRLAGEDARAVLAELDDLASRKAG